MIALLQLAFEDFDDLGGFGEFEDPGMGTDPGIPGSFIFLFLLVVGLGIAGTVWRVSTARRMAERSGLDPDDATAMTLLADNGLEATYLASNLRPPAAAPDPPVAPATPATPGAAERLRELNQLRELELITQAEYDARRQAIIDGV